MKILALEASGGTAGCALAQDGRIIGEYEVNYGKTHSQTLVPMLEELRRQTELDLSTVDAVALTAGPGSFTGLRIGAATAKGIALALEKPVIPVSTLESLACNLSWLPGTDALICPVMDARRQQVYTAIYEEAAPDARPVCILEPCALSVGGLTADLNGRGRPVLFLGDGVPVYRAALDGGLTVPHGYAPGHLSLQRAATTAVLAEHMVRERGEKALVPADDFRPVYLRRPLAEQQRDAAQADGRMAALAAGRLLKETRAQETRTQENAVRVQGRMP